MVPFFSAVRTVFSAATSDSYKEKYRVLSFWKKRDLPEICCYFFNSAAV